jgi:hypothetical protein
MRNPMGPFIAQQREAWVWLTGNYRSGIITKMVHFSPELQKLSRFISPDFER